jgi:putative endonuclease
MEKLFCGYIMASKSRVLYTGITGNLHRRTWEHKSGVHEGFSKKYRCTRLVYYEKYNKPRQAIAREKEIKGWLRCRKIALIEAENPTWEDLAAEWYESATADSSFPARNATSPKAN